MPLSAASVLSASCLVLLLLAATAAAGDSSGTTAISGNSSAARPSDDTETYLCYLCDRRNPMLIKYCPIYWDWCHLMCYDGDVVAAAALRPAAPAVATRDVYGQDCYVMKLYQNGSYVIVSHHDCSMMARCILSCGGGDVADSKALGVASARPVAATAPQGMLPPPSRVAEFQRCGDQAMALSTRAVPGGV
jgi:anaphase-promoting complex subunit 6